MHIFLILFCYNIDVGGDKMKNEIIYEEVFAKRLSKLRTEKGVSARDMSLSIGQGAGYINNVENGKFLPSMMSFFYICDYLNVSPKDFFDFDNNCPEELIGLINDLKSLDKEMLSNVSAIITKLKK